MSEVNDEEETADPDTWFKISPSQNPRHSVSVTPAISEEDGSDGAEGVEDSPSSIATSPSDLQTKRNVEAFSAEKSRQRQLTSSARFELVRKQRRQVRGKIHTACAKARKVKEGARRDAAAAQACLVVDGGDGDVLLGSREPYVMVERSEAPSEHVDFTTSPRVAAKESRKPGGLGKKVLPKKNWKGEKMGLMRGAAYVFIVVD
jgi:hypothetical protein